MTAEETSDPGDPSWRPGSPAEKTRLVRAIFDSVAPHYDLMNDLMSAGIHRLWKREMVAVLDPHPGQFLVDVAGGTGDIALLALPRLSEPGSRRAVEAVVCDPSTRMLAVGRARALDAGILSGIEWVCADAEGLPFAERSVDLYSIAFGLRNLARIDRALAEARRVLRPGGRFLALEFAPQLPPPWQALYDLYSFRLLPLLGEIVTGNREAYLYLADSIRQFPRQSELSGMIAEAGLGQVKFRNLTGGLAALYSAWRL